MTNTNGILGQDPFARKKIGTPDIPSKAMPIAATSNIDDTSEKEMELRKGLIPEEASTEDGYQKMLAILEHQKRQEASIKPTPAPTSTRGSDKTILSESPIADTKAPEPEKPKEDTSKDKPTFKDEELLPLIDSILNFGFARDEFNIRNNIVILRSHFTWEDQHIVSLLDEYSRTHNLNMALDFMIKKYNLAAALEQIGSVRFNPIRSGSQEELTKSFNDRVDFIDTLPMPLVDYIFQRWMSFNEKVRAVSTDFERLAKVF